MRVRVLLGAYTLAMAFTLVYGGEHFVTDILAGWAMAAAVVWVVSRSRALVAARQRSRAVAASQPA
jgi:membrane-associated phospholipid phosphatase